jgi:hypothetical protein
VRAAFLHDAPAPRTCSAATHTHSFCLLCFAGMAHDSQLMLFALSRQVCMRVGCEACKSCIPSPKPQRALHGTIVSRFDPLSTLVARFASCNQMRQCT